MEYGIIGLVMNNHAFIDGQNLVLGTTMSKHPWKVDLYRFREYLRRKYNVTKAYYFIGCINDNLQSLYDMIQDAGFILVFRAHYPDALSNKKGNVDTDIVFTMMRNFHECTDVDKFFLISGDGDYYKMVKYLNEQGKFGGVLFPARGKASSLYRQLGNDLYDFLDKREIREKIELKNRLHKNEGLRLGS